LRYIIPIVLATNTQSFLHQARKQGGSSGRRPPQKNVCLPGKICYST